MIGAIAQGLFISGLSWLGKIAYAEASRLWLAAKQNVAALEDKPLEKEEKARRVTAALAPLLPDQYEGPATILFRILIDAAIYYCRYTSRKP
jgi:hypothetical protein